MAHGSASLVDGQETSLGSASKVCLVLAENEVTSPLQSLILWMAVQGHEVDTSECNVYKGRRCLVVIEF